MSKDSKKTVTILESMVMIRTIIILIIEIIKTLTR
jgi:hypothetical protein